MRPPLTVEKNFKQTMALIDRGLIGGLIEPTSAVFRHPADSHPVGSGHTFLAGFGSLVPGLRYRLTLEEFDSSSPPLWKYTEEELRQRRAAAEGRTALGSQSTICRLERRGRVRVLPPVALTAVLLHCMLTIAVRMPTLWRPAGRISTGVPL